MSIPLRLREDEIGRKLDEAHASGELASAPSYGKPLLEDAAWEQAPADLRMSFKILKDAGMAPPEVALFHERAQLRREIEACPEQDAQKSLRRKLCELEQRISLRLEALRTSGSL